MQITMWKVRETPGTVLFAEPSRKDGKPRNFYVPKGDFVALGSPSVIVVTIEASS